MEKTKKAIKFYKEFIEKNESHGEKFAANVAKDALESIEAGGYEDPTGYLTEIFKYGCIEGAVSRLVYYKDTFQAFRDNIEEIEDIINEAIDEGLFEMRPDEFSINNIVWAAYEVTALKIREELEALLEEN